MSWKVKKPKAVEVASGMGSMGGASMGGGASSMGKIVFSPPNFLFSSEEESIEWLKGRRCE